MITCHRAGSPLNPTEELMMFRDTLLPKGTGMRYLEFQHLYELADHAGRLPDEAAEVLLEIKDALADVIKESNHEKEDRLEREFEDIFQERNENHQSFFARFRKKVGELKRAKMTIGADEARLYRKYSEKMNQDLRRAVMFKEHKFSDGLRRHDVGGAGGMR